MKKHISVFSGIFLAVASVQAAALCFTRGPEGADSYTRNWSDAQNWDTVGTIVHQGEGWNTSGNTTVVPKVGDSVYFYINSAYNGTVLGDYSLNLDVEATIKSFAQNDVSSVITKLSSDSGKSLTLSSTTGGVVIEKTRCVDAMTFDVNVVLSQTGASTMSIFLKSDQNMTFNKDIIYVQESGAPSQWGDSMAFRIDWRSATQYTTKESGDIVINGSLCTYDTEGNRKSVPRAISIASNKSISSANLKDEDVGKIIFQGDGYTMGSMNIRNGMVVDLNRNNAGAACLEGSAIELYNGSTLNFVGKNQLRNVSIQFKSPDAGFSNYGGIINMMGNTVDNISYLYFSNFVNNKSFGKVDFGDNNTAQWFVFSDIRVASDATAETQWGLDIFNFDAESDHIRLLSTNETVIALAKEHIYFSSLGERDVDYIVTSSLVEGFYEFSYEIIPEPSTFGAIFGVLALAIAARRRRK